MSGSGESQFQVVQGTYGEIASWLPAGGIGIASDVNNVMYVKDLNTRTMKPLTKGVGIPYTLAAAGTLKIGDVVTLAAGGLPTLPALLASGTEFNETPPVAPGQEVKIFNSTGAAINVATGAGASINGAAVGTAYALAAGATKTFVLDGSGTNWVVI